MVCVANWQLRGDNENSLLPSMLRLQATICDTISLRCLYAQSRKEAEAIYNCGMMVAQTPGMPSCLATWWVRSTGCTSSRVWRMPVAININRRTRVWPNEPFKATVRGINMPNTLTLVRSIEDSDANLPRSGRPGRRHSVVSGTSSNVSHQTPHRLWKRRRSRSGKRWTTHWMSIANARLFSRRRILNAERNSSIT